jgi:hypothetical protein
MSTEFFNLSTEVSTDVYGKWDLQKIKKPVNQRLTGLTAPPVGLEPTTL